MTNRIEFLANPDVSGFIAWLGKDLIHRNFNLNFSPSRFVPGGLNVMTTGIESVLAHYRWKSSWVDGRNNQEITSCDWSSTKISLARLSQWLNQSIDDKNESKTYEATIAVLKWGGVSGASRLLHRLYKNSNLVQYLTNTRSLLSVNRDNHLEDITPKNILKFDSGLTKIHALHDNEGSPIYDTRVAAAVSMLYCLYRQSRNNAPHEALNFPCGDARGKQLRNPGNLGFRNHRKFYTSQVPHHEWARTQLRLGWIFRKLLEDNKKLFENEGEIAQRAHALEAALFMIGYDLRCFNIGNVRIAPAIEENPDMNIRANNNPHGNATFGIVPSVHNTGTVISRFLKLKQEFGTVTVEIFNENAFPGLTANTISSYRFPLRTNEFDLFNESNDSINLLSQNPYQWLQSQFGEPGFVLPDERQNICLINTWCVGYINRKFHYLSANQKKSILVTAELAGTPNAANAIQSVGRSCGHFFDLLDQNGLPTENFNDFFKPDNMIDLANEIDSVGPGI